MQNQNSNVFLLVKAAVAAVCGAFTAAFGWLGWLTAAWAMCMVLDWLSGTAAACKGGRWSSAAVALCSTACKDFLSCEVSYGS